jgi:peroxiredoxin
MRLEYYRKILILVIIIAFIPAIRVSAQFFSPFEIEKLIGEKAPDFTAKSLSDGDITFSSYQGKPVLLNFWATWCPYCREERPELNALYRKYHEQGLMIISVSVDRSPEIVRRYLRRIPADFIVLHDSNREAMEAYGVYSLPTSFLISKDGVVKNKFIGPRWTEQKKRLIEELLK